MEVPHDAIPRSVEVSTFAGTPDVDDMNTVPTVLMLTNLLQLLPTSLHYACVCNAGFKGYCVVKEMLQNGTPGRLHLIESCDLRNVDKTARGEGVEECCVMYTPGIDVYEGRASHDFKSHLPSQSTVTHIIVYNNHESLPPQFLSGASTIISIDFNPIRNVTHILDDFLENCTGLTEIDLGAFSQVTSVGTTFLIGCSGLTTIDLSPLSNLVTTEHAFLCRCTGLKSIDLSPLSRVRFIASSFLFNCRGLKVVDMSTLVLVEDMDSWLLEDCPGVVVLLPPMCGYDLRHGDYIPSDPGARLRQTKRGKWKRCRPKKEGEEQRHMRQHTDDSTDTSSFDE